MHGAAAGCLVVQLTWFATSLNSTAAIVGHSQSRTVRNKAAVQSTRNTRASAPKSDAVARRRGMPAKIDKLDSAHHHAIVAVGRIG
jgi:hypothetical protein